MNITDEMILLGARTLCLPDKPMLNCLMHDTELTRGMASCIVGQVEARELLKAAIEAGQE